MKIIGQMIRSKKEYLCINCGFKAIKWAGFCNGCQQVNTLQEKILVPTKNGSSGTLDQKRLRLRSKKSEREIARQMLEVDGPDPAFKNIASSTGRIGHITGMRVDAISKNYVTENKNRKLPVWLIKAWILINQRGQDFQKNILLHIEPPNMPREVPINGGTLKLDTMAVITQNRHEELIRYERAFKDIQEHLKIDDLEKIRELYWESLKI